MMQNSVRAAETSLPPAKHSPKSAASDDIIDLTGLIATIWRGKLIITLVTAVMVLLGGYYAFKVKSPLYESTAVIILDSQKERLVDFGSVVDGLSSETSVLRSEVEVLQSRSLLAKVVEELNLTQDPEFNWALAAPSFKKRLKTGIKSVFGLNAPPVQYSPEEQAERDLNRTIDSLLGRMLVVNLSRSLVFEVTVMTSSAKKSAQIADTIADLYILNQLDVKFAATKQATEWLTDRVSELQLELEAAEEKVSQFKGNIDLVSVEALQALERQLKDLRDKLTEAKRSATSREARLAELQGLVGKPREDIEQALSDTQLSNFLTRYKSSNDDTMAQAFDNRVTALLSRAQLETDRAKSQVAALSSSIENITQEIEEQNQDLIRLQQLNREAEASRLLYEYFLGRLKETSVQQGIQQADSRVLSRAVPPLGPSAPNRMLIIALFGMIGIVLGTAIVLVVEMLQNTFRTARDLEGTTGYSVFGQLPLIPVKRRADLLGYLAEKPTSAAAEAVRNLRTSVLLSNIDSPPQVIMSTSSLPGEGKTTVSLSLAQNMSGMGKRVLLIEGDIRRRVFSQYLNIKDAKGLLSVLSDEAKLSDTVVHDDRVNADILVGEASNTNAADIFSSERFHKFIAGLRDEYDYIVIDTPPVLVVPDARIIAQVCDAILFTVKWDATPRAQVEEALHMFETVGQRVSGLILNQISPRGMKRYGYGGKYGAYSAYGRKYYTN